MELIHHEKIFFKDVETRVQLAKMFEVSYGNILATKFNAFHFIEWNEKNVSSILAFFLNPNENHQQGDLYLNIFSKRFSLQFDTSTPESIVIKTEDTTLNNRRIDIVMYSKTRNEVIGIENKIYTHTTDQKIR